MQLQCSVFESGERKHQRKRCARANPCVVVSSCGGRGGGGNSGERRDQVQYTSKTKRAKRKALSVELRAESTFNLRIKSRIKR